MRHQDFKPLPESSFAWFSVALVLLMASLVASLGHCQEKGDTSSHDTEVGTAFEDLPEKLQRYHRLVDTTDDVYQITIDGEIHQNFIHRRVYRTPKPLLEILCEPNIAKEFDISATQRNELEKQIDLLDAACDRAKTLYEAWDAQSANALEHDTLKALESPVEEAVKVIRDSLAEADVDRFRQILLQMEIVRRGMLWFVESKLGDEVGLTVRQKKSLKKLYVQELRSALKEIQTHKEEAIAKLYSVVPQADREKMLSKVGDRRNLFRTPLKLMALQVDSDAVESFRKYQGESQWPKYTGISLPFSFKVAANGGIVFSPSDQSHEEIESAIPVMLMIFCLSDGELVLVAKQSAAVRKLHNGPLQMLQAQEKEINDWIHANNSHEIPREMHAKHRLANEKFRKELVPTIERILLPHQHVVMEEFAARSRYSLHGPLAYLFNYQKQTKGQTEEFALTAEQCEKLLSNAEEFQAAANTKLVELEIRLNTRLRKALTDQQRKNFDAMAGRWLELESGNLEFHATFVERPNAIWGLNRQPIWMDDLQVDPNKVQAEKPGKPPAGAQLQRP